jgi:plastocyanin
MARRAGIVAALAGGLLALPGLAAAGYYGPYPPPPPPPEGGGGGTQVEARGNPFSGGLGFAPARLRVAVGTVVRWTNTDDLVPHTATEENGIFDLGGDYGPPGMTGFGPGQSVSYRLPAGRFSYLCRIHAQMTGVVAAPVKLSLLRARGRGDAAARRVRVVWARRRLPAGQAFDVQRRVGAGTWRTVRRGTRSLQGEFAAAAGRPNGFRARVRLTGAGGASGYSPPVRVNPG